MVDLVKKVELKRYNPNSFNGDGQFLYVHQMPDVIRYLEFSMEFQSNKLIDQKEYTKRQQMILFYQTFSWWD